MAGDTQDTSTSEPQQPESWDASQFESALAHLERLQERLDGLRSIIPSLVAPLTRPTDKSEKFTEVRKSALQSATDLNAFREQWTSEPTQQLFARSRQSLEKDGDLSKSLEVAKWGWFSD